MTTNGLHHVTAISGPARRNIEFYAGVLGLRLVKKTVNFDDPGTYHFYYGDADAAPGSILTFFPWAHVAPGRLGVGETQGTMFRVPEASIGYWAHRFVEKGVKHEAPVKRFGETMLAFTDPDGMRLALVGVPGAELEPGWAGSDVPAEAAIRGLKGVGLLLADIAPTAAILTDVFGFKEVAREGAYVRYATDALLGNVVDLHGVGNFLRGRQGGGSVHHIAFRAADDAAEEAMVKRLAEHHGIRTTEQKDRNYFRSVYFREPGGVLFEIATDVPGFAVDEPAESLGTALKLPSFLEPHRAHIESVLPDLSSDAA
ncbi:ring-cleaving dioxygenase [Aquabacter sp. L1I39]|uniref:ring-cleaving dioxygenase n=1 Tax=Aquabacter sp. L1I39 TaxID=2820278 RepID=UPI001ADADCA4|nr:ring-cleaving dioxygenase [Aquabacter sp. L1I39]QTL05797.1 ring-cleaving dioxygenase [Aquabacter sp. L1I39]